MTNYSKKTIQTDNKVNNWQTKQIKYRKKNETKEDPYEKIRKLKELLDIGALSQNEFEGKKNEILKSL